MQTQPLPADHPTTPPVADGLLEKIKNFLFDTYQPTQQVTATTTFLSTKEIYTALQDLYPCIDYGMADVAQWLHEKGFTFTEISNLRLEWMLEKA